MSSFPPSPVIGDDDEGGIVPSSVASAPSKGAGGKGPTASIPLTPEEEEALADGIVTLEEILQERAEASGSGHGAGDEEPPPWMLEEAEPAPPVAPGPGPVPPNPEPVSLDALGGSLLEEGGEERSLRFASFGVSGLRVGGDAGEREDLVRQARDRGLRGVCGLIGFRIPVNKALRDQAKSAAIPKNLRLPQPMNPGRPRKEAPHAAHDKLDAVTPEKPTMTMRHAVFGSFEDMIPTGATPLPGGSPRRSLTMTPLQPVATAPLQAPVGREAKTPEGPPTIGPAKSSAVGLVVAPRVEEPSVSVAPLPAAIGGGLGAVEEVGLQRPDPELVAAIDLHEGEIQSSSGSAVPAPDLTPPERSAPKAKPAPQSKLERDMGERILQWPSWGTVVAAGLLGGAIAGGLLVAWRDQARTPDGSVQGITERRLAARTYIQGEIEALEFRLGSLDVEIDGMVAEMGRQDAKGKGELAPSLEVKARERARVLVVLEALKARRRSIDEGKGM